MNDVVRAFASPVDAADSTAPPPRMDFIALLNGFLTPDNTVRKAAEAQLQALKVHTDALPLELTKASH